MKPPTARQLQVLDFIAEQIIARGYCPTLREIGMHFGIASTNGVNDHILRLIDRGLLTRDELKARALRVTDAGRSLLGFAPRAKKDPATPFSSAPRVTVNYGMRCGKCNALTFTLDKPCTICRMERRRVA